MSVVIPLSLQLPAVQPRSHGMVPARDARHPLIGSWCTKSEYLRTVIYTIRPAGPGLTVTARDSDTGEEAEVSAVELHGDIISFCLRWRSSGRVCQCAMQAVEPDSMQYTFTYIEHDVLLRRQAEPA
jgi:hypothetical protein